jgi:hypothetical protein
MQQSIEERLKLKSVIELKKLLKDYNIKNRSKLFKKEEMINVLIEFFNRDNENNIIQEGKQEQNKKEIQEQNEEFEIKSSNRYTLLSELTQYSNSKTKQVINRIVQRTYESKNNYENNNPMHKLSVVITNKNLIETEQWCSRLKKEFNQTKIEINMLSSKSDEFTSIDSYIVKLISKEELNDLPDILVMCYHSKRVCYDLITLINACKNIKFEIRFDIYFDEPDENLFVTEKFLKYIEDVDSKYNLVNEIVFITATPLDKFWNTLHKKNIFALKNFKKGKKYDENEFSNYHSFKDNIIQIHNNETENPLDYIKDIFDKNLIQSTSRNILFVPAHQYVKPSNGKLVGSHDEICQYFLAKGYCTLLINGTFKGFMYPTGRTESISDFRIKHKINDELYEVLRKWNEINSEMNLAITGNLSVERGVTFNTSGFNFTHMILSNYHSISLQKLIQFAGRSTGHKNFVKPIHIFCTEKIKTLVFNYIDAFVNIEKTEIDEYHKADFDINSKDAIPVKIKFLNEDIRKKLINISNNSKFHNELIKAVENKHVILEDKNNINKFDILKYKLKTKRIFKEGHRSETRRYDKFNDAFVKCYPYSQQCNENQYTIDLVEIPWKKDNFENPVNIGWLSYKLNTVNCN